MFYEELAKKRQKKRCKKVAKKFGGKEKVRIFAARLRNNGTKQKLFGIF